MWEYTDKVKEHFLNPRNVGTIEDADAVGEVGSLACGDALKLFLKIDDNDKIVDAPRDRGTVVIFPSFVLHRVTRVTKGRRRSIVGWISGMPYR